LALAKELNREIQADENPGLRYSGERKIRGAVAAKRLNARRGYPFGL